jgi:PAS domain S-box-containing protein
MISVVNHDIGSRNALPVRMRASRHSPIDTDPPFVIIWIAAPDGRRHFLNQDWPEFTGRGIQDLLRKGWTRRLHPEDAERCLSVYMQSFEARSGFEMEYRIRCTGGQYRWISEQAVPCFGLDGSFNGYVGCTVDNNEWKAGQDQTALPYGTRTGLLSGRAIHHFTNLLKCILAEGSAQSERALTPIALQRMEGAAIHAHDILRQLMLCELSEHRNREPLDLRQLTHDLAPLLRICMPKGGRLQFDLPAGLPRLQASAAKVRLILLHLALVAAFSSGVQRRTITIRARPGRCRGEGLRTGIPDGGYVSLEISGVRAFACAALPAGLQSGDCAIKVTTDPADDSRLQVLFPAAGAAPAVQPTRNYRPGKSLHPQGPILLVEDEVTLRIAVSTMLSNRGFAVLEAGTGELALDLIRTKKRIAVVLLDLTLPGKSGRQVFEELRRIRPRLKVILTSAHGRESLTPSFGALQHAGFIRKPYRFQELEELIRKILPAG